MKRTNNHSSRQPSPATVARNEARPRRAKHRFAKRAKLEPLAAAVPEEDFPKLNQSDPVHARRIQQRRRMVAFGKNTVGYDEYTKKVPKQKRRPKCMKHPSTPDHTLDIPTKRWQGLIRAWRKALHQYDPPDLMKTFAEETSVSPSTMPEKDTSTVQAREIAKAATGGLLVDLNPVHTTSDNKNESPVSLETVASSIDEQVCDQGMEELDAWENTRRDNENDFLLEDDDSDDELL